MLYNAQGLTPSADADGDGITNAQEAAAGTNPFDPTSAFRISSITQDAQGVRITFPTQPGKSYQAQSSSTLAAPSWQNAGGPLTGTGSVATITLAVQSGSSAYYHVTVSDLDTDGDGVTDWEEIMLGFNPNSSHSQGLGAADDRTAILQALQAVNIVSASAPQPVASKAGLVPGSIVLTRSGNLNPFTAHYTVSGTAVAGIDYVALTGTVKFGLGVNSATIGVVPLAATTLKSPQTVIVTVSADPAYSVGTPSIAAVLISDDPQPTGAGLLGQFWDEGTLGQTATPAYAGIPQGSVILAGLSDQTAFWPQSTPPPGVGQDLYWSAQFSGEMLPQYSQLYTIGLETNFAGRMWVNGQLIVNNWPPINVVASNGGTSASNPGKIVSGTIFLNAGVRVPVFIEQYTNGKGGRCYLTWSSVNQSSQFIPASRLFANTPPQITSPTTVLLLQGSGPYVYQIVASANPSSYGAVNLPPGWTFNSGTGQISGSPSLAGVWNVPITATNAVGSGSAILQITVASTGGMVSRDTWINVPGTDVAQIPTTTAPSTSDTISSLEAVPNSGVNFGERLRGYITAPVSGAYQFWLAGADSAQLSISNDSDPANLFVRAALAAPGSGFEDWAHAALSPLLWMDAGSQYYVEILHKQSAANGHLSVGWLRPDQTGKVPSGIVPGYTLSPYIAPAVVPGQSTLYTANLAPVPTVGTSAGGSASLLLSADQTQAVVNVAYANLSSPVTGKHIHSAANGGIIILDLDTTPQQADGSYLWNIGPVGPLSAAGVVNVIQTGNAYVNVHTVNNPAGEVKGFLALAAASQTFTPPPTPPAWSDDHGTDNGAARFLTQATFGPSANDLAAVKTAGYEPWINNQFTIPATHHLDYVIANRNSTNPSSPTYYTALTTDAWWLNSTTAPDQLRQRVAFALSEIFVISSSGVLEDNAQALSSYYDMLLDNAFGNVQAVLSSATLAPGMGIYLDMLRNDKPNIATGYHPDENYAREIQQLFSVGLNRLFPDGSLMLNSKGQLIPTYDQNVVMGMASVFTGWNYNQPNNGAYLPSNWYNVPSDYTHPMREVPAHHFTGQKRILNNVVLPGLTQVTVGGIPQPPPDPNGTPSTAQIDSPEFQTLPSQELADAIGSLFNHPNCGPFICKELIQRLVTSTPSRGYVYRVVQAFDGVLNVDGISTGVRGDLKDVIRAILLDYEARSANLLTQQGFGKQKEPVLRVTEMARAFPSNAPLSGTFSQQDGLIQVTTSADNRLAGGSVVDLDFSADLSSPPTGGPYSVISQPASLAPTATSFYVRAKDAINFTYSQTGNLGTLTTISSGMTTVSHNLSQGADVYLTFTSGSPNAPANGLYPVTVVDTTHVTIQAPDSVSRTATGTLSYFTGGYAQSGSTITVTCNVLHNVAAGGTVGISFVPANGQTIVPALVNGTVLSVIDPLTFTVAAADSATRSGTFTGASTSPILTRTGPVASGLSDWLIGTTDTDIAQTPMRSPTVFNFFSPGYQYPGTVASAGLLTPEFQLTSDTNVMKQANFAFGAIFSSSNNTTSGSTGGLGSFRNGSGQIAIDYGPWMGDYTPNSPWAANVNLPLLIGKLNTLLCAGELPAAAQTIVQNYIQTYFSDVTSSPVDQIKRRDRVRSIIHLIATSPDFAIQK